MLSLPYAIVMTEIMGLLDVSMKVHVGIKTLFLATRFSVIYIKC